MRIRTLTLIAAMATTLPAIAMADALDDAIEARQGYYQVVKHNAGLLFGAFVTASTTLAENAGGGLDALRANIGALGASCKGCHDTYRAKDF